MDEHGLIVALKQLASELGQTPTRIQFETHVKGGKYQLEKLFRTYTNLVNAAGLAPSVRRKITNQIFEKDLGPHLEEQHEIQVAPRFSNFILPIENYPTTVALGDFHAPFQHVGAVNFAIEVIRDLQPKRVIQGGDLRDMFSGSKYPRSHNLFTPKEEIEQGTKACTDLWKRVQEAAPKAECYQLLGNHDVRPYKRVLESCPELEMFIDLKPLYTFPGVKLIEDPREELELDGVFFHHGYLTKLGANRDFMNACTVNFHTHKGGVVYRAIFGGHMIWECNAGTLGDPDSKGLSYTQQKHHHQTLGLSVIDKYGPRFIPYRPKQKSQGSPELNSNHVPPSL